MEKFRVTKEVNKPFYSQFSSQISQKQLGWNFIL